MPPMIITRTYTPSFTDSLLNTKLAHQKTAIRTASQTSKKIPSTTNKTLHIPQCPQCLKSKRMLWYVHTMTFCCLYYLLVTLPKCTCLHIFLLFCTDTTYGSIYDLRSHCSIICNSLIGQRPEQHMYNSKFCSIQHYIKISYEIISNT